MKSYPYTATLGVTHRCNLNCRYCYQQHTDNLRMSIQTAKKCIDEIGKIASEHKLSRVTIEFIGGEPILEYELIKEVYYYAKSIKWDSTVNFFATTNGTVLTEAMKLWFAEHRSDFILGLSLDGTKETHNYNRSNSFEKIDTDFFVRNYPDQAVKMTISEYSLHRLFDNVRFVHELGFKRIAGMNFAEAYVDWDNDDYVFELISQLGELEEYYLDNPQFYNQFFAKRLYWCATPGHHHKKYCGTGSNMAFFDTDGRKFPCAFFTPMTFDNEHLRELSRLDFCDDELFVDKDCYDNCYIYPLCNTCAGANYKVCGRLNHRDRRRCKVNKVMSVFLADFLLRKALNKVEEDGNAVNDKRLQAEIIACKQIKKLYYPEFQKYFEKITADTDENGFVIR